jgi:DNA-binding response OmpR family regulator
MSSWEEAFSELREEYIRGADERLSRIAESLSILERDPGDSKALLEIVHQFHGLSGSGATYGFPKVSAIGLQGEQECNGLRDENRLPGKGELDRWRFLLEELEREFSKREADAPERLEEFNLSLKPFSMLVVDDDEATRHVIIELSEQEGMTVLNVNTMADAMKALEDRLPDGLITNIYLPDGSGYELVEHLRNLSGGDFVTVFMISTTTNFLDKVEAIRSGADCYFEKPIDLEALSRRLRFLLERNRTEPARILSVEEDPDQAAFLRAVLESAGYQVSICDDPKNFEVELARFRPDLVLMDVMLPGVSAYDLARYIHQNENYAMLPILFLTTQGQTEHRMEAVKAGGDDHLVKPLSPTSLLTIVAARIERTHFLKSLLERGNERSG